MALFRLELTLRYTRVSCMPYRATLELSHVVSARDREDALRQGALCVDRDLEEILSKVNTLNVSDVIVEARAVQELETLQESESTTLWNLEPFGPELAIPRHIIMQDK
jgi:hypothetical protein